MTAIVESRMTVWSSYLQCRHSPCKRRPFFLTHMATVVPLSCQASLRHEEAMEHTHQFRHQVVEAFKGVHKCVPSQDDGHQLITLAANIDSHRPLSGTMQPRLSCWRSWLFILQHLNWTVQKQTQHEPLSDCVHCSDRCGNGVDSQGCGAPVQCWQPSNDRRSVGQRAGGSRRHPPRQVGRHRHFAMLERSLRTSWHTEFLTAIRFRGVRQELGCMSGI